MLLNNTSFQAVWVRPFWGKVVWLMSESLLGNGQQGHLRGCKREPIWNLNENFKDLHEGSFVCSRRLIWDERDWDGFNLHRLIPTWGSSQPWCSRADLSSSQLQGTPRCRAGKSLFLKCSSKKKHLQVCKQWKEVVDGRRLYKQLAKKICSRKVNIGFTRSAFQKQLRDVRRGRFKKKNKSWSLIQNLIFEYTNTRSLRVLRAPTSNWRLFGPLVFVVRILFVTYTRSSDRKISQLARANIWQVFVVLHK